MEQPSRPSMLTETTTTDTRPSLPDVSTTTRSASGTNGAAGRSVLRPTRPHTRSTARSPSSQTRAAPTVRRGHAVLKRAVLRVVRPLSPRVEPVTLTGTSTAATDSTQLLLFRCCCCLIPYEYTVNANVNLVCSLNISAVNTVVVIITKPRRLKYFGHDARCDRLLILSVFGVTIAMPSSERLRI
jgi:hypothetical protein